MKLSSPKKSFYLFGIMAMLLLFSASPKAAVDFRLPSEPVASSAPSTPLDYEAIYDLVALRYVLSDLSLRARYFRDESTSFTKDTELLWGTWRRDFGFPTGVNAVGTMSSLTVAPAQRPGVEKFQFELFRLVGSAQKIDKASNDISAEIRVAESVWDRLGDLVFDAGTSDPSLAAESGKVSLQLKGLLNSIANKNNLLDTEIGIRQAEYNELYSRIKGFLQEQYQGSFNLPIPSHWIYLLSNRPRPTYWYDFDPEYAKYNLNARRKPLPQRPNVSTIKPRTSKTSVKKAEKRRPKIRLLPVPLQDQSPN